MAMLKDTYRPINTLEAIQRFTAAMRQRGLVPGREGVIADGVFHRCSVARKGNENDDGSYTLRLKPIPCGGFNNWTDGQGFQKWRDKVGRKLTPVEVQQIEEAEERAQAEDKAKREKARAEACEKARKMWRKAKPAPDNFPYCVRKGVQPRELRMYHFEKGNKVLLVPMHDAKGNIQNVQRISEDGSSKGGLKYAPVSGMHYWVATPNETDSKTIVVATGWATGESIYQATGYAVVLSFDDGNLKAIAEWVRSKYPDHTIIVAADDDWQNKINSGLLKAQEAARAISAKLVVPRFGLDRGEKDTDFNDMHQRVSLEAVKEAFDDAKELEGAERIVERDITVLEAKAPVKWAGAFLKDLYCGATKGLVHYRGVFYAWAGTHFEECDDAHLRSLVYAFLDRCMINMPKGAVPFNPDQAKVNKLIDALKAGVEQRGGQDAPFWRDGRTSPDPANLIACRNGLLDFTTRKMHPHSVQYFNLNCLPFDYDPEAPPPKLWHKFLRQLWPDKVYRNKKTGKLRHDKDGARARRCLQEMIGLSLTPITSQQKIFMLVGPPRCGKGTIGRVMERLLGSTNCVHPTMASLSGQVRHRPELTSIKVTEPLTDCVRKGTD
jgi:phage/plasmid primase-like uncharacterized protein